MNEEIKKEMIRYIKEAYFEKGKKMREIAKQLQIRVREVSCVIRYLKEQDGQSSSNK